MHYIMYARDTKNPKVAVEIMDIMKISKEIKSKVRPLTFLKVFPH